MANSDSRIIFRNDDGRACIIIPADKSRTVDEIAKKDVPTGKK